MDTPGYAKHNNQSKLTVPQLLQKLDEMYAKEDKLKRDMILLKTEYDQLQEDKELLQMMIYHQSNKKARSRP